MKKFYSILVLIIIIVGCDRVRNVNINNIDSDYIKQRDNITNQNKDTVLINETDTIQRTDTVQRIDTIQRTDTVQRIGTIQRTDTVQKIDTIYKTPQISEKNSGYRYYKFVVEALGLGGTSCAILTETSFRINDNPVINNYEVLSNSEVGSSNISERDMPSLFDGDITVGSSYGKYIKFTEIPWQWIVDMGNEQTYTSMLLSSHETFFYQEPSHVKIYGSNDLNTWNVIADVTFTEVYHDTLIPLQY